MTAWSVDVLADILGIITGLPQVVHVIDFHKSLCISLGFGNSMTPIIYLIGSGVFPAIYGQNSDANKTLNNKNPQKLSNPDMKSEHEKSDAMQITSLTLRKKPGQAVAVGPVIEI